MKHVMTMYLNAFFILLAYILTLICCAIVQILRNFQNLCIIYFYLFSRVFASVVEFLKDCKHKLKCKNCLYIILKVRLGKSKVIMIAVVLFTLFFYYKCFWTYSIKTWNKKALVGFHWCLLARHSRKIRTHRNIKKIFKVKNTDFLNKREYLFIDFLCQLFKKWLLFHLFLTSKYYKCFVTRFLRHRNILLIANKI